MEFLKDYLDEETYAKVSEQLKDKDVKLANLKEGKYVDVQKYDTLTKDLETTQATLLERENDITKLKDTGNTEQLNATITDLETKYANQKAEYEEKLAKNKLNSAIDIAIANTGTIDRVGFKAHLDLSKISYEDDKLVGFDEQLEVIKENQKHYFEASKPTGIEMGSRIPPKEKTALEDLEARLYPKKD